MNTNGQLANTNEPLVYNLSLVMQHGAEAGYNPSALGQVVGGSFWVRTRASVMVIESDIDRAHARIAQNTSLTNDSCRFRKLSKSLGALRSTHVARSDALRDLMSWQLQGPGTRADTNNAQSGFRMPHKYAKLQRHTDKFCGVSQSFPVLTHAHARGHVGWTIHGLRHMPEQPPNFPTRVRR
jgi:hypothetical protein